ncbi:ABC transporter ATP-binding protein [Rhodospirillum rubrum]|uniref:ABC transporter, transmembrane region n=2 Tax=Rhodospirillum rubrum TaxID=1085 RepID=Q2RY01_RHORT|nr:ABC transporter ATP-binding protein [Rhodospirillum rubrum]ABC20994.1 ABC transporter, transmembrane region [Rhodospirillum rubrum ATCC 11170]HAQ01186.1 ABC transporter ATP-binding protein [Rhodospirillum rubrum]HCF19282.1 ABC transporter ATP-binding protein [Rhodospirillum rubrum]
MAILFDLIRQRAALLSLAMLASAGAAVLGLAPLLAIYTLALEIMGDAPDRQAIHAVVFWTALAMGGRWLLLFLSNNWSHMAAYALLFDLRLRIADRLTQLPLGFILTWSSGDLKRVLQEDVERLEMVLGHTLTDVVAAVTLLIGAGIVLVWMDPIMAAAAFAPLPVAIGLQAMLWRGSHDTVEAYTQAAGRMNAAIVEFIRAIPVIKTFGRGQTSMGHLKRTIDDYQGIVVAFSSAMVPAWVGFMVALGSGLLFVLPIGGWRLLSGAIDGPTFILFLLLGVGLMQSLVQIITFGNHMRTTLASIERVRGILDAPTLAGGAITTPPASLDVSFSHVSFSYGEKKVLDDITLTCPPGARTAIVGPSGAGKTTLAHLAARFWDPQQGAISIGGVPLSDYAPETLVRLTASVFQDVFLFHDTILANLRVGAPDATREQVIAAAREAQIHDFIMTLPDGYDTVLGDRGARLSGGEKQRLSIARAILKDAPIVILDEATAFADPVNERRIRTALERLCRDKTVITIAHRLSTIQDADQIAVLDDGRLVDVGRHDILLTHCAVYQRLWSAYTSPWDGGNGSAAHPPHSQPGFAARQGEVR